MSWLSRIWNDPDKPRNMLVYRVSGIVDGNGKASPVGVMPKFPVQYEGEIRKKHRPKEFSCVNETIGGKSVILYWMNDRIESVCFLQPDHWQEFPGFRTIPEDDLKALAAAQRYFPTA